VGNKRILFIGEVIFITWKFAALKAVTKPLPLATSQNATRGMYL
jgi:hypothetical protein